MSLACRRLAGRENALHPGPGQAFDQEQKENRHGQQRAGWQLRKRDGKRPKKNRFHVKDQKDQTPEVLFRSKLDPGVAPGLQAALVNRIFVLPGLGGTKAFRPESRQEEGRQGEKNRQQDKDRQKQIRGIVGRRHFE